MGLVSVDLDREDWMALTTRLCDLPEHCAGRVGRGPNENDRSARLRDARFSVRLPHALEGLFDRVVNKLEGNPLLTGVLGEKIAGPAVLHLKAHECARRHDVQ